MNSSSLEEHVALTMCPTKSCTVYTRLKHVSHIYRPSDTVFMVCLKIMSFISNMSMQGVQGLYLTNEK